MTLIALQAPTPPAPQRVERPTPSSHALPPVAAVPALPDQTTEAPLQDRAAFTAQARSYRDKAGPKADDDSALPQPFPELRFADPLPDLPELDLPAKAAAYQAALSVVRTDPAA